MVFGIGDFRIGRGVARWVYLTRFKEGVGLARRAGLARARGFRSQAKSVDREPYEVGVERSVA